MNNAQEKVVLVTGATSGIGGAIARRLIEDDCRVALVGRRTDRLQAFADAFAGRVLTIAADVSREEDAERIVADTIAWAGKLDVLINNAGVSRGSPHERAPVEDIRLMLETNVFGLLNLTRLAMPAIKVAQGTIINVASTAALAALPNGAAYSASKAAVATFSECLRKELASDNVRVTTLFPGFVDTELFDSFDDDKKAQFDQLRKHIEVLVPRNIADVISMVLSLPQHVSINDIVVRPTKQAL